MHRLNGFTLIELLVVITIIVILLALLTPAMDKAIYQAELAQCAANLNAVGKSAMMYAMDFKRHYPHRPGVVNVNGWWWPHWLVDGGNDDRPKLKPYIAYKQFNDPLSGGVDFSPEATQGSNVLGNNPLWFGFRYAGHRGMLKVGDRFSWTQTGAGGAEITETFNLLSSDWDLRWEGVGFEGSHADDNGIMHLTVEQNDPPKDTGFGTAGDSLILGRWTLSRWIDLGNRGRGLVDQNFMYQDGSVKRLQQMKPHIDDDERLTWVPLQADGGGFSALRLQIPRN